jgi:FkbM family methyltransferase
MSLRSKVQKTLETVLPGPMYAAIHAAMVKRRAERWLATPDATITTILNEFAKPGDVVLDIGANLGQWALLMSRHVGPQGHVHSFEPADEFHAVLTKMLTRFKCTNVTAHRLALSDKSGTMGFVTHDANGEYLSGEAHIATEGEKIDVSVQAIRLDEFVNLHPQLRKATLMKIDVEGAEMSVFKGGAEYLRAVRPVIHSEVEDRHCARYGHKAADVFSFLDSLGYNRKQVTPNDFVFTPRK